MSSRASVSPRVRLSSDSDLHDRPFDAGPRDLHRAVGVPRRDAGRGRASLSRLAASLGAAGIAYHHESDLGGRRGARPDSVHTGWRSASFRGYADHMTTPEFQRALARLREIAAARPTAIMCAESVPWRCHRQLIADALIARGESVGHILDLKRVDSHRLSPHARILADGSLQYPGGPSDQLSLVGG